jgi:hypothetical protein
MMRGKVEPRGMLIVVKAMLIVVHVVRKITAVPHTTSPHEKQLKEQRQRDTTNDIATRGTIEGIELGS